MSSTESTLLAQIRDDPTNPELHARLGDVYATEAPGRAVASYVRAASLALVGIGRPRRTDRAVALLERALPIAAEPIPIRLRLAETLELAGRPTDAEREYRELLAARAFSDRPSLQLALLERAAALAPLQLDRRRRFADRLAAAGLETAAASELLEVAELELSSGQHDSARAAIERARHLAPGAAAIGDRAAELLSELGQVGASDHAWGTAATAWSMSVAPPRALLAVTTAELVERAAAVTTRLGFTVDRAAVPGTLQAYSLAVIDAGATRGGLADQVAELRRDHPDLPIVAIARGPAAVAARSETPIAGVAIWTPASPLLELSAALMIAAAAAAPAAQRIAGERLDLERALTGLEDERDAAVAEAADATRRADASARELTAVADEREELAAKLEDKRSELHEALARLAAGQRTLDAERATRSALAADLDRRNVQLAEELRARQAADDATVAANAEVAAARRRETEARAEAEAASAREAEARAETEAADTRAAEARTEAEAANVREAEARAEIDAANTRETEARAEANAANAREAEARTEAEAANAREAEAHAELDAAHTRAAEARAEADAANARETEARAETEAARAERAEARAETETAKIREAEARAKADAANARETEARAETEAARAERAEARAEIETAKIREAEARAEADAANAREAEARTEAEAAHAREAETRAEAEAANTREAEARAEAEAANARETEARAEAEAANARETEARAEAEAANARETEARTEIEATKTREADARAEADAARAGEAEARAEAEATKARETEARAEAEAANARETEARAEAEAANAREAEARTEIEATKTREAEARAAADESSERSRVTAVEAERRATALAARERERAALDLELAGLGERLTATERELAELEATGREDAERGRRERGALEEQLRAADHRLTQLRNLEDKRSAEAERTAVESAALRAQLGSFTAESEALSRERDELLARVEEASRPRVPIEAAGHSWSLREVVLTGVAAALIGALSAALPILLMADGVPKVSEAAPPAPQPALEANREPDRRRLSRSRTAAGRSSGLGEIRFYSLEEYAALDATLVRRAEQRGYRVTAKLRTPQETRAWYGHHASVSGWDMARLRHAVADPSGEVLSQFRFAERTYFDVMVENLGFGSSFDVNTVAAGFALAGEGGSLRAIVSSWDEPSVITSMRDGAPRIASITMRLEFATPTTASARLEFRPTRDDPSVLDWAAP